MADKKLNDLAQLPSLGSLKNIYVEDANGVQYKLTKESLAEVLGGLIGINDSWFRYRGNISDLKDANKNGVYEFNNDVIGNPSTRSGRCFVFGSDRVKSQLVTIWDSSGIYYKGSIDGLQWTEIATK